MNSQLIYIFVNYYHTFRKRLHLIIVFFLFYQIKEGLFLKTDQNSNNFERLELLWTVLEKKQFYMNYSSLSFLYTTYHRVRDQEDCVGHIQEHRANWRASLALWLARYRGFLQRQKMDKGHETQKQPICKYHAIIFF